MFTLIADLVAFTVHRYRELSTSDQGYRLQRPLNVLIDLSPRVLRRTLILIPQPRYTSGGLPCRMWTHW